MISCDCGNNLSHDEWHDCYFCEKCDKWKKEKCSDSKCEYCSKRPDKPSLMKKRDNHDAMQRN